MFASKQKSPAKAGRTCIFFVARIYELSNRKILQDIYKILEYLQIMYIPIKNIKFFDNSINPSNNR
jgi:S-adenosylmethionine synthetase